MEKVLQYLEQYKRLKELERQLPGLEQQLRESKQTLREARLETAQAKWELNKAEEGSFLQKLLGNQEEKKEKAYREYREATAREQAAKQECQKRTEEKEQAQQEYNSLQGSWEVYLRAKEACLDEDMAEKCKPVLAAIALVELNECLDNLEKALPWMRADVRTTRINPDSRKLEFLGNARTHAGITLQVLEQLPENSVQIPGYLKNPDGFIMGVAMAYKQLDRMDLAQEQLRELRAQLKGL